MARLLILAAVVYVTYTIVDNLLRWNYGDYS